MQLAFNSKRLDEITMEEIQTGKRSSRPEPWDTPKCRDQGDDKEHAEQTEDEQPVRKEGEESIEF